MKSGALAAIGAKYNIRTKVISIMKLQSILIAAVSLLLANCVEGVREAFPKATVTRGFSIYGHEVRTGRAKVEKWLKEIGLC